MQKETNEKNQQCIYLELQIYLVIHSYCTPAESIDGRNGNQGKLFCLLLLTHLPSQSQSTGPPSLFYTSNRLTNHHLAVLGEIVLGNLEVERRRSLSYAARDVVVGSVAGAEPAAKVAGLADGDTSEMGADTCYN